MRNHNMNHKPVFMIITNHVMPVPDVMGGGTEALVTNLIDVNEREKKARFVITSIYNNEAVKHRYNYSKVYYFDNDNNVIENNNIIKSKWKHYYNSFRINRRILHNRYSKHFFGEAKKPIDYLMYQLIQIAKLENVDYVITFQDKDHYRYRELINYIGSDRVYYYLVFHRKEIIQNRKEIINSICLSKFVQNEWVKDKSLPGKHFVLYNGTNLDRYKIPFDEYERQVRRSKLGISENDYAVVFCGRLIPAKGVEQLLSAFEKLRDRSIKLILIGSVSYAAKTITEFSERIVEKAKKMENVIFLGYVPCTEMYNYYGISDAEVIPSVWQEGAGLIAVEGMFSGLPLIITESGGMVEYVTDETAIKLPIDDDLPNNIASAIIKLSKDKELCKRMGEAGKKQALLFSAEAYYNNFLKIFNQE